MPPPAMSPKDQAAEREYISNCAFLHQLSADNKNIDRRIIARADEYRKMQKNARYLTKYRFSTMKRLLDELAALLVSDSDEAIAIAVARLTKDKIQLIATINSSEDGGVVSPVNENEFPQGYSEWRAARVERHSATIFRLAHEYLAAPDLNAQADIESQFRITQVKHSLLEISDLFDRLQGSLDDVQLLKEEFFTPEALADLQPCSLERYFVDEFPASESSQDDQLASRLIYVCLESLNSSESVKARLKSKKKVELRVLTAENLYIWHELFTCAFTNARLALIKVHELRADGKEEELTNMLRVFCVYLDYIDAFTNKSKIFREYAGIVMKHAVYARQILELQLNGFDLEVVLPLGASTVRIKKYNRESQNSKEKPLTVGKKARKALQQMFSNSKSILSAFRHKTSKPEPQDNDQHKEEMVEFKTNRNKGKKSKFKTGNELFQSCSLISTTYRRSDEFLRYVIDAEQLTQRETILKVIRVKQHPPGRRPGEKLESCLHRFLHVNHLTKDEISARVKSFLSFFHVMIPSPNRCRRLLSNLNDDNPTFPIFYHPELVLLAYLGPSPQLAYPYIGVSRPPCMVCEHLLIQQRTLEVREGSGKVYAVTVPGRIPQKDKDFIHDDVKDLTARIVNDIQTTQRNRAEEYQQDPQFEFHTAFPGDELENFPTDSRVEDIEDEKGEAEE
ncbi:hypothetical protein AOL_s00210g227 [Orbilia oligospora ATCC 24927]|uniref:Uncharacterized protein n=1 Tax=Arthrobotrys oligospora (strain ATCC 24927 / CBS 115.81 / DSM 1491) TaxID=756982 RepID=G1XS69_ARTOA|nr:hypothetical protein AOL_s00210g227 [Orbilia oligospora ATCC 24927]EGX44066.1 hypothetical protein AOL_s00210g227 [Orbilia oligospora ATCC 24927]